MTANNGPLNAGHDVNVLARPGVRLTVRCSFLAFYIKVCINGHGRYRTALKRAINTPGIKDSSGTPAWNISRKQSKLKC